MDKKTFLHEEQLALGAKMVSFAGWSMPLQYTSIIEEHNTVRNAVGLFDVSHMGELFITGEDSELFIQNLVPQNIEKLKGGKAIYCQLTNTKGGIIDDFIIYKLYAKRYLFIMNAARIDEDLNWLVRNKMGFQVEIENPSHNYSLFAVQGPYSIALMSKIGMPIRIQPEFFNIRLAQLFNINCFVSRTGYTGEDGFEILVRNEFSSMLWNKILDAGREFGIKPIGLGARDSLRLESALHLYGNDLTEDTTPIEARLTWSVSRSKEQSYNGRDVIMDQLENGVKKKLIGFKMLDKAIARHEHEIYYNDKKIGTVTSGGYAPTLKENIGLGYVSTESGVGTGSTIQIKIRDKFYNALIVKRPFIDKKNRVAKKKD